MEIQVKGADFSSVKIGAGSSSGGSTTYAKLTPISEQTGVYLNATKFAGQNNGNYSCFCYDITGKTKVKIKGALAHSTATGTIAVLTTPTNLNYEGSYDWKDDPDSRGSDGWFQFRQAYDHENMQPLKIAAYAGSTITNTEEEEFDISSYGRTRMFVVFANSNKDNVQVMAQ